MAKNHQIGWPLVSLDFKPQKNDFFSFKVMGYTINMLTFALMLPHIAISLISIIA